MQFTRSKAVLDICYKNIVYDLPNDLRLKILGKRNFVRWVKYYSSTIQAKLFKSRSVSWVGFTSKKLCITKQNNSCYLKISLSQMELSILFKFRTTNFSFKVEQRRSDKNFTCSIIATWLYRVCQLYLNL